MLQKGELFIDVKGKKYSLGTISKEFLYDRGFIAYVFDIDEKKFRAVQALDSTVSDFIIPGIDVAQHGFYQAYSNLPYFI